MKEPRPRLYLIHCGFYEEELSDGIFEFHVNIPVVALDVEEAKRAVRVNAVFMRKKMHVDGIQAIDRVGGFDVTLCPSTDPEPVNQVTDIQHRDL